MNTDEKIAIQKLVEKMDDARCKIQKGEAVVVEGGIQQVIYEGEVAINRLLRCLEDCQHSRGHYESLFHEAKRDCREAEEKVDKLEELVERYGKVIDHLLEE